MAGPSSFPNAFLSGVTIRNVPITISNPGIVFWLGNSAVAGPNAVGGSDGNPGTFTKPFGTLMGALAACVAGRGDVICVKPGHAENFTAAGSIALSKAGVAVVGLGSGSLRPTFTSTTAATASITVTASNVSIKNLLFVSGFAATAACLSIANAQVANDLTVDECEFRDGSTTLNFVSALTIGTTAGISSGLTFTNNKVVGIMAIPTAATTAIVTASDASRWNVSNNHVTHSVLLAATACLIAAGANNLTNTLIRGNVVCRPNTDASNPLLMSNTGILMGGTMIADNYCGQLSGATGLVANVSSKASFIQNFAMITGAADRSGLLNPVGA